MPERDFDIETVAAVLEADADVLPNEDGQHGRRFGALRVENPFA